MLGVVPVVCGSDVKPTIALISDCTMRLRVGDRAVGFACALGDMSVQYTGSFSMSVVARASLFNEKKSASVHELAGTGATGPRTDPNGREMRKGWDLVERLEAENLELRNRAVQLALQIQILRRVRSALRAQTG